MKYYLFLDDSGQLHKNYQNGHYFVFGGLLLDENNYHQINKAYRKFVRKVMREKGLKGELKTSNMKIKTRRRLLRQLNKYECPKVFVYINVTTMKRLDFSNKRAVLRFKNYMIRRLIQEMVDEKLLDFSGDYLEIHIDNQNIARASENSLEDHLYHYFNEENYQHIDQAFTENSFRTDFKVFYRDSATNYLIQAADLLANTKYHYLHEDEATKQGIIKLLATRTVVKL